MTTDMFHLSEALEEQELLTLQEPPSSPPVFSGVRFTRSLVLCACFVDCCLSFDIRILVTSIGTLGSVASFLEATLYQGNPDRNHKLSNIVSIERQILHTKAVVLHLNFSQYWSTELLDRSHRCIIFVKKFKKCKTTKMSNNFLWRYFRHELLFQKSKKVKSWLLQSSYQY
jgi:hypothetical protein